MMCAQLKVTRAGFYAWQTRQASERDEQDALLLQRVRDVHERSRGFYGSPRVTGQLRLDGLCVGRRRIARLMRLAGLQGELAPL
jgi:putative transposase